MKFTAQLLLSLQLFWVYEFKSGRTSTKDQHCSGCPETMSKMIDKIHDIVLNDRRIKMHEIVEATGICKVQCFLFCTKNWVSKKSRQDGCQVCFQ